MKEVDVGIDLISSVYQREVYRIQCFVAFSINCGERPELRDFAVPTPVRFGFSEEQQKDSSVVDLLKSEYNSWIAAISFAQLTDLLSLYLDDVYLLLGLAAEKHVDLTKEHAAFEKKSSVNDKIRILESTYSLGTIYTDVIGSKTNLRNCIIHRHGIVAERDFNEPGKATLRWKGFDLTRVAGSRLGKLAPEERGPALKQGEGMTIRVVMKERSFGVGEKIRLTAQEIGEIFWSTGGVISDVKDKVQVKLDPLVGKEIRRFSTPVPHFLSFLP